MSPSASTSFNLHGLASPESKSLSENEGGSQVREDSEASGTTEFFNFSGLSPAFTAEAYARFLTDQVRDLAIQQRYGEAIELGDTFLAKSSEGLYATESEIVVDLRHTLEDTRKINMTRAELGQERFETPHTSSPTISSQEPALQFSGGRLFSSFDNAIAMPDPDSPEARQVTGPEPVPHPAPSAGYEIAPVGPTPIV